MTERLKSMLLVMYKSDDGPLKLQGSIRIPHCVLKVYSFMSGFSTLDHSVSKKGTASLNTCLTISRHGDYGLIHRSSDKIGRPTVKHKDWALWIRKDMLDSFPFEHGERELVLTSISAAGIKFEWPTEG